MLSTSSAININIIATLLCYREMKKHNQHGFSGLAVLLLLAVVLTIGGIGNYLYGRNQKKPTTTAVTAPAPGATGQSTSPNGIPGGATGSPSGSSNPTASTTTVIKVSEAGFQITVPNSIKDLTYHAVGGVVNFSTASITAAIPECAANRGSGAFQTVTRGNGTYQPPSNASNGGLIKQYSGYYLSYTLPTGPCAKGLSVENQNLLNDQAQAFYSSLSTVTAL